MIMVNIFLPLGLLAIITVVGIRFNKQIESWFQVPVGKCLPVLQGLILLLIILRIWFLYSTR
jgi:hypothetical protein